MVTTSVVVLVVVVVVVLVEVGIVVVNVVELLVEGLGVVLSGNRGRVGRGRSAINRTLS